VDLGPINDLAKEFGISRETVYNLIRKHNLQTYKQVGDRRTYVDRDDFRPLLGPQPKRPASDGRR
jgi:transposase